MSLHAALKKLCPLKCCQKIFGGMSLIRKNKIGFLLMLFGQCQVEDQHLEQKSKRKLIFSGCLIAAKPCGEKLCGESMLATKIASL